MITERYNKIYRVLERTHGFLLLGGFCITLLVAATYVYKPSYLNLLELKLYDTIFQQTCSSAQTHSVAIVDIDDQSLKEFGQWPWPRYRVALLLQKINLAGALAVGMDILFAEPDGTSPLVMKHALKRDLHIDIQFSDMPDALLDNDKLLANVLKQGPYVLGSSGIFSNKPSRILANALPEFKAMQIKEAGAHPADHYLFQAQDLISPLPVLLDGSKQAGFMNTITDRDGVLRRTPLLLSWQQKIYPQLSIATLLTAFDGQLPDPIIKVAKSGIESIKIGDAVIPLEANSAMLINYRGPSRTFPYISAGDILNDRTNPKELKGKIIFLGTSAAGLKDIRVSPLDQVYPGVEVHATIVDNILSKDFIHRPDWAPGLELSLILLWGLITTILIGWASAFLTIPITLLLAAAAWLGGMWSLEHLNIWISPFFPLIVLALNFSALNMQKFWSSEKKKKFFKSAFSKYVSKAVVNQLAENPDKLSLEGEDKEVSILFSDIRGFTSISEQLTPTQITLLLHDYFTPITKIIINNFGTHDKFIGDAVMSFWNAPVDVKNHEHFAIKAALEMIDALIDLNKTFQEKFGIQIAVGIGLHSGHCRVGNMGSDDIFDYTIIGDNVNLTSRLESLTKFYGVQIIISDSMLKGLTPDLLVQELDQVKVKGKGKPVRIYTVYSNAHGQMDESRPKEIKWYQDSLKLYKDQQFEQAHKQFTSLAAAYPDQKLYAIYQERCALFMKTPPGERWDGVFTHTSK
ncbi:MAG: adenylate/guanylate cyclase domain-containing protein [Pseudomonadota bacterium]